MKKSSFDGGADRSDPADAMLMVSKRHGVSQKTI
jgi:hypothetical protein